MDRLLKCEMEPINIIEHKYYLSKMLEKNEESIPKIHFNSKNGKVILKGRTYIGGHNIE